MGEIQAIIRQITASVTFLPLLEDGCESHLAMKSSLSSLTTMVHPLSLCAAVQLRHEVGCNSSAPSKPLHSHDVRSLSTRLGWPNVHASGKTFCRRFDLACPPPWLQARSTSWRTQPETWQSHQHGKRVTPASLPTHNKCSSDPSILL